MIELTLKVLIESFADEPSAKGNYSARGITFDVVDVKGAAKEQLVIGAPQGGNGGSLLLLTKDVNLVKKMAAAKAARGKAPRLPADVQAALANMSAEHLQQLLLLAQTAQTQKAPRSRR